MLLASFIVRPVSILLRHGGRGVAQAFDGMKRLAIAWQNRRDIVQLTQLSAHELKDIGLTRSDVVGALDSGWFEDPSLLLAARSGVLQENAATRRAGSAFQPMPPRPAALNSALATGRDAGDALSCRA